MKFEIFEPVCEEKVDPCSQYCSWHAPGPGPY